VNTALPPAGLETDCGHCRISGGAEERQRKSRGGAEGGETRYESTHQTQVPHEPFIMSLIHLSKIMYLQFTVSKT